MSRHGKGIELPDWIFDVDEEDEIDSESSLLQELEIDMAHIYKSIIWMYTVPCLRLVGKPIKRHPLHLTNATTNQNIDFWGPCSIVSLYGLVLWLGRVHDVPWIYIIWSIAAVVNHLISRVWYKSTLMIHVALLGYSIASVIPFAAFILFIGPPVWLATVLEIISVIWSAAAGILSYSLIFTVPPEDKSRLTLLYPSVILMEVYLISLLPIRH